MKTIQVTISDDLYQAIVAQAKRENISLNALVSRSLRATVALRMLGLTVEERAGKGNLEDFDRIMARVPNVAPVPGDERD